MDEFPTPLELRERLKASKNYTKEEEAIIDFPYYTIFGGGLQEGKGFFVKFFTPRPIISHRRRVLAVSLKKSCKNLEKFIIYLLHI